MNNNQKIKELISQLTSNITLEGSYKDNNCWYVNTTLDNEEDIMRTIATLSNTSLTDLLDCMVVSTSELDSGMGLDFSISNQIEKQFKDLLSL